MPQDLHMCTFGPFGPTSSERATASPPREAVDEHWTTHSIRHDRWSTIHMVVRYTRDESAVRIRFSTPSERCASCRRHDP